ncbi:class I SAM-dependent methyltransferase [Microcoleus sp. FACHB-68]|uniref:class I SAM-dependent methyltransferase n=1 Tax=Microcoleus sp. FACHB-68 TaxID=2692826 RepID=UPI001688F3C9|nr:class I SAM-dependent methyltransferase [Microcoleus sp. FACHB-68]MBD1936068.1 class I SAM-dependent methyltransferase [Microcoleus sp. FACHB-68]
MQLTPSQVANIENFLQKTRDDIYPEPPSPEHTRLTYKLFDFCLKRINLPTQAKILDVGCGQGIALEMFKEKGYLPVGITLGQEDINACRTNGYEVYEMDQSFLEFGDAEFDFLWCRHCIEHSIFPYYTLSEFYRVLKPEGYLYIEVPAPDTVANHQRNQNHYSVFGKSMWEQLIIRAGFQIIENADIKFPLRVRVRATGEIIEGIDNYWAFISKKSN